MFHSWKISLILFNFWCFLCVHSCGKICIYRESIKTFSYVTACYIIKILWILNKCSERARKVQSRLLLNIKPISKINNIKKWSGSWRKEITFLFLCDKGTVQGCGLGRGKLLSGGRFIMCFMTALSSVAGGALTSKTAIVFGFGSHKDSLLAKT